MYRHFRHGVEQLPPENTQLLQLHAKLFLADTSSLFIDKISFLGEDIGNYGSSNMAFDGVICAGREDFFFYMRLELHILW